MSNSNPLFSEIRELIISARKAVSRSVDTLQVLTHFEIGRRIVEHEQQGAEQAEYGKQVLKELSKRLTDEFGKGFSLTNLKLMRQFFLLNRHRIGQTASGQLTAEEKSQTVSEPLRKSETLSRKLAIPSVVSRGKWWIASNPRLEVVGC